MTTNDATPRDAIAIALVNSLVDVWQSDDTVVIHADHIDPAVNEIVAHLWERADDPTVMREVASAISQIPFTVLDPRITARTAAAALLSALLGPRPQETADER